VKMGGRNVVPTYLPSTAVGFLHLVSLMVRILNSGSTGVLSVEPTGTCNGDLKNIISGNKTTRRSDQEKRFHRFSQPYQAEKEDHPR
jgi:hypothetical protein